MSKETVIGYIVQPEGGDVTHLSEVDRPGRSVLVFGMNATVFPTRAAARNAVMRTRRYAESQGYNWSWWNSFVIHRFTLGFFKKLVKP